MKNRKTTLLQSTNLFFEISNIISGEVQVWLYQNFQDLVWLKKVQSSYVYVNLSLLFHFMLNASIWNNIFQNSSKTDALRILFKFISHFFWFIKEFVRVKCYFMGYVLILSSNFIKSNHNWYTPCSYFCFLSLTYQSLITSIKLIKLTP